MGDKYIIKNCPCYVQYENSLHLRCDGQGDGECQDCTDCVMKQTVEKCKKEIRVYENTLLPNDGTNTLHFGRQSFAYDILSLLDVQEVE